MKILPILLPAAITANFHETIYNSDASTFELGVEDEILLRFLDPRARWSLRTMSNETVRERLYGYKRQVRSLQEATQQEVIHLNKVEEAGKKSGLGSSFMTDINGAGGMNGLVLEVIDGYGCNCRSRKDFKSAYIAHHMDELDLACKHYIASLRCTQFRYPECDVQNVAATDNLAVSIKFGQLKLMCMFDGDECSYQVCQIELQAMMDQIKAQACNEGLNEKYILTNGFDAEVGTECAAGGNTDPTDPDDDDDDEDCNEFSPNWPNCHEGDDEVGIPDKCCGEVPYLNPYNSHLASCCEVRQRDATKTYTKGFLYKEGVKSCCRSHQTNLNYLQHGSHCLSGDDHVVDENPTVNK